MFMALFKASQSSHKLSEVDSFDHFCGIFAEEEEGRWGGGKWREGKNRVEGKGGGRDRGKGGGRGRWRGRERRGLRDRMGRGKWGSQGEGKGGEGQQGR